MVSLAQLTLTNTKLMTEETVIVVIPTAYHSMPALVCMAQVADQSILKEPLAALSPDSTAERRTLCQALTQLSLLAP